MMHSNSTSKIVIGVGLAVVFGVGTSVFAVRVKQEQDRQVALHAQAPAATDSTNQKAVDPTASTSDAATALSTDQTANETSSSPLAPSSAGPADSVTGNAARGNGATAESDSSTVATPRKAGHSNLRVASTQTADGTAGPGAAAASDLDSSHADAIASNQSDSAETNDRAGRYAGRSVGTPGTSTEQLDSDSNITAAVKSEIGMAAPISHVEVTTTNGVVALAGSVPSEDEAERARLAAERVAGVKYVDSSALVVDNH